MPTNFLRADELTTGEKIEVLKIAYAQIAAEIKRSEDLEHKATITICTLILLVAGFVLRTPDVNDAVRLTLAALIFVFAILGIWFLVKNAQRLRNEVKDILRIEQILGLFEPENFVSKSFVEDRGNQPHDEPTVFTTVGLDWGNKDVFLMTTPHIAALLLTALASALVILVS